MAEDWGQEYGEKQFAWNKDALKPGLDHHDANLVRDATSPFDKKHPVKISGAPAGAPGAPAAPDAAVAPSAPMDIKALGEHGHVNGETQAEDWGQEFGPKQYQWNKDAAEPGMDNFDKNLARDANSPFDKKHPLPGGPAGAPAAPAAPAASDAAGAPMATKSLGEHAHESGDT